MLQIRFLPFIMICLTNLCLAQVNDARVYLRVNQLGYLPGEDKIAIIFSNQPLENRQCAIVDALSGRTVWGPYNAGEDIGNYGNFTCHYRFDFSEFQDNGRFKLRLSASPYESCPFNIGEDAYDNSPELLLEYLRQLRCGYNPFLDEVCHRKDGRTMYGPMPDSTYIDVSGGWHDAGDHLRYLLTSGNTVGRLLLSYRENRGKFKDEYEAFGHRGKNGLPDILDEAKWGLDWMLKMHPVPGQLFHQVADDRDHQAWDLPSADSSDYGWGPGSYRVVYYATGKPQGLGKYQNTSSGIANLAGRYAAAMAMAAGIWRNDLNEPGYAAICLKAGREVYEMGKKQPGAQEGTPCMQPYRYYEHTWADDMEWGAAELFRETGDSLYLKDALKFAATAGATSWMGADSARHYEYYPFMNMGHYALFSMVDQTIQKQLAGYYREGIEKIWRRGRKNPYHIGIPFIWCSNNLAAAFVNQCLLYEKMTADQRYHSLMLETRDWLLGRNPWSVSMFVGIPASGGDFPEHPHSVVAAESGKQITGGLVDGPVYGSIFNSLKGIRLLEEDPYAPFQSSLVVYHDDLGDYSTNEPTLDGTAEALFFMAFFAAGEGE